MKRNSTVAGLAAGIVACALLGTTEARAVPYEVTIEPGAAPNTVVATSNEDGDINLAGLTATFDLGAEQPILWSSTTRLVLGSGTQVTRYTVNQGTFGGPATFGTGPRADGTGTGDSIALIRANPTAGIPADVLWLPVNYSSGTPLAESTATFPGTLAGLGLTPGTNTFTWGGAQFDDQSFTINVVPGPIVGAGLPGLIAALGGLVAMARRRRKQLA